MLNLMAWALLVVKLVKFECHKYEIFHRNMASASFLIDPLSTQMKESVE